MTLTPSMRRLAWPLLGIVCLLIAAGVFSNGFFDLRMLNGHLYGNLIDILRFGASPMLVALGMTFVIATGGVDLSVGAIVAISGSLACYMVAHLSNQNSGGGVALAIVAALGLSMLLGLWNGFLVGVVGIQPIIATLILMVAGRGIAQLITSGAIITINSSTYGFIENGYILTLPFAVFVAVGMYIVASIVSGGTRLGMLSDSVGGNAEASRLAAVRSRGLIILAYVFSGLCSGIAGLMESSGINGADGNNAGLWFELDAIAAVVIGGTALTGGRYFLAGTAIGALLIQTMTTTIYVTGVPPETQLLFKAIVVAVVILIQSPKFRAKVFRPRWGGPSTPLEPAEPSQAPAKVVA